jgi:hypothetical protein
VDSLWQPAPAEPDRPGIGVEQVFPAGTPTPAGYRPGLVMVRDFNTTVTPAAGADWFARRTILVYGAARPDCHPDWRAAQTRVAYLDSQGLDAWISLQGFQNDNADPDLLTLPDGVPTVTYTGTGASCDTESAPDYGAALYTNALTTTIASLLATFGSDDKVAGFDICVGVNCEVQNVQNETTCTKRPNFEAQVTCTEYLTAVKAAMQAYRAGTDKPLTLDLGLGACAATAYDTDREVSKYFLNYAALNNLYIAYRHNGLQPDQPRAWMYGTPAPYGRMQAATVAAEAGGVAFEPQSYPSGIATADVEGFADFMLYGAVSSRADNVFLQKAWFPYIDSTALYGVTMTLGTTADNSPAAWVVFRESEYDLQNAGTGFEYSGVPGAFTHLVEVVGAATPTTLCSPNVYATSVALGGSAPPRLQAQLSSPAARESRNALRYNSSAIVGLDVADAWQYADGADHVLACSSSTWTITPAASSSPGKISTGPRRRARSTKPIRSRIRG